MAGRRRYLPETEKHQCAVTCALRTAHRRAGVGAKSDGRGSLARSEPPDRAVAADVVDRGAGKGVYLGNDESAGDPVPRLASNERGRDAWA
jgi:hypothetical protein